MRPRGIEGCFPGSLPLLAGQPSHFLRAGAAAHEFRSLHAGMTREGVKSLEAFFSDLGRRRPGLLDTLRLRAKFIALQGGSHGREIPDDGNRTTNTLCNEGNKCMSNETVWVTADKAKTLVEHQGITAADQLIIQKAGLGLVSSRAAAFGLTSSGLFPGTPGRRFWQSLGLDVRRHVNWSTGDFVLHDSLQGPLAAVGVEFSLNDLIEAFHLPQSAAEPSALSSPAQPKAKGGRPRKDWWDDFWIEIGTQLYVGELHPKRQADVEKAMREWIASNGFSASPSTVRERAQRLWKMIQQKGENPPD